MIKQTALLLKLKFSNFLGINEARHSGKKKNFILIMIAFCLVGLLVCGYVVGLSYLIASIGLGGLVPVFLTVLTSLIIFFFTIFKAGAEIFDYGYYLSVAHLPLKKSAIISARLIGMYITDAIISFFVFVSGAVGVSIVSMQGVGYYLMIVLSAFLVPVLPLCVSCFVGVGVSAIISRLKKGKLVGSILLCLLVCAFVFWTYTMPEDETVMINAISDMVVSMSSIYPPALWVSQGITGENFLNYVLFALGSVGVAIVFVAVVAKVYTKLCSLLGSTYSSNAKVDIKKVKKSSPFFALYKKEIKRLFSSMIYFTNTLMGNIMAIIGGIALLFVDFGAELEGIELGPFLGVIVVGALSIFANMAPTTTASIGIEGKNFATTKSLPVSDKTILGAKLACGLTFSVPTAIIITCLLPFSPLCKGMEWWIIAFSPIIFSVAMPVVGLVMNVKFPSLKWTNEQVPVKQGKAVLFTMLTSFAVGIGYIVLGLLTELWTIALLLGVIVAGTLLLLYYLFTKVDLKKID